MSTLLFKLSAPKRKLAPLFVPIARPVYQALALTATTAALGFTDGFQPLIVPGSNESKIKRAGPDFPPCDTTKSVVLLANCPVTVGVTVTWPAFAPFQV